MATIKFRRGTSYPNGLTAGEPAFRTDTDQLYVHDGVTAIWVGALISTADLSTGSTLTVPTQSAVKAYVDANIAGGAVTSVNGITGAVGIAAGTAITIGSSGKTLTIANNGVQSFNGSTGAVSFVNYVASAVAGSNITVSSATGNVTIGVTSTPSFTTVTTTGNGNIGGNLTVTGNLTINGTTTTVNTDTLTVDDPIITLGLSGGVSPAGSDGGKDKGIAFYWYNSPNGQTGFFGWDSSTQRFGVYSNATFTNDVVDAGSIAAPIYASGLRIVDNNDGGVMSINPPTSTSSYTFTLPAWTGTFLVPSTEGTANYIIKSNGAASQPTWIDPNASGFTAFAATKLATARTFSLTGNVTASGITFDGTGNVALSTTIGSGVVTNAMLVNSGFTLGSTNITLGSTTTTLAGLSSVTATTFNGSLSGTATTATNVTTTEASGTIYLAGVTGVGTSVGLQIDTAATALSYAISTGTLTCTKVEAIVDGGAY